MGFVKKREDTLWMGRWQVSGCFCWFVTGSLKKVAAWWLALGVALTMRFMLGEQATALNICDGLGSLKINLSSKKNQLA